MPKYTMESGGKKYTFSSESPLSDADLEAAAKQYFGGDKPSAMSKIGQILKEEGAKLPGKIASDVKGMGRFIANPPMQDILPWTLGPAGKGAATGIVAGIERGLGRSTATGVGAAMDAPAGQKTAAGLKAGGMAWLWEGILSAVPYAKVPFLTKSLKSAAAPLESREREFAKAGESAMKGYEALKDSVPTDAFMIVPSISKKPITFKEASQKLGKLEGVDYEAAHKEIAAELSRYEQSMEKAGLNAVPYTAQGFKTRVSPEHFQPTSTGSERFAKGAVSGLKSPLTRTATDIVASQDTKAGVPLGAYPPIAAMEGGESLYDLAKRLGPVK